MNTTYQSSQDIIQKLEQQRDLSGLHIQMPADKQRSILLIGPTRAGKSTITKVIQDSLYQPPKPTLFSSTEAPEVHQIGSFRIIDMPGFNDLRSGSERIRLIDNSIMNMLQNQLQNNNRIDIIAFVFSLSNGIRQEDIDKMVFIQSKFSKLSDKMILIITHAEDLNNETKNNLIQGFFQHPDVKRHGLQNFFQRGYLFIGCLRYESFNQLNCDTLVFEHQNVLEMRKKFIEKCFEDIPLSNIQSSFEVNHDLNQYLRPIGITIGICALAIIGYQSSVINKQNRLIENMIERLDGQSNDIQVIKYSVLYNILLNKLKNGNIYK